MTKLRAVPPGNRGSILGSCRIQTISWTHPAFYPVDTKNYFPGRVRLVLRSVGGALPPLRLYTWMKWCLIQHRDVIYLYTSVFNILSWKPPGIESRWGRDIPHQYRPPWVPPSLPYNGYHIFSPRVKRPGRGVNHPHPSSAEVKERVELYVYFPSGPSSWTIQG